MINGGRAQTTCNQSIIVVFHLRPPRQVVIFRLKAVCSKDCATLEQTREQTIKVELSQREIAFQVAGASCWQACELVREALAYGKLTVLPYVYALGAVLSRLTAAMLTRVYG